MSGINMMPRSGTLPRVGGLQRLDSGGGEGVGPEGEKQRV